MARVLILEPQPELQELLSLIVGRIGHEAVVADDAPAERLLPVEAVLLEPSGERELRLARALRAIDPDLAIVCVSVLQPNDVSRAFAPIAHLIKPFGLGEVEAAVTNAIAAAASS